MKLPATPSLIVGLREAVLLSPDGELDIIPLKEAKKIYGLCPVLCHRKAVASRLKAPIKNAYDILELFAFVYPARLCIPTVKGVAEALSLDIPETPEDEAQTQISAVSVMLSELSELSGKEQRTAVKIADAMCSGNWVWGEYVLSALRAEPSAKSDISGFRIWDKLPEWHETMPDFYKSSHPVSKEEATLKLKELLSSKQDKSEERSKQIEYTENLTSAFNPKEKEGSPWIVLAEAGTGIGKTLGYIAPASIWAEKNDAAVWISTYTKNLQRQLDNELDSLFTDKKEKEQKVVIRKGRENYLCLLNLEEALNRIYANPKNAQALGLICRWAEKTRNGDMTGGDLSGWLCDLLGRNRVLALADRRGECIFSACPHYRKCFIERTIRKARKADIVVANHALVMIQSALGGLDDTAQPERYIFDEGHHLFGASDSAFSLHLTCRETLELRRWLLGAEHTGKKSRAKGLRRRAEDIIFDNDEAVKALEEAMYAARVLPTEDWHKRLDEDNAVRDSEKFFAMVLQQVYARSGNLSDYYSIETETAYPVEGLLSAAAKFEMSLEGLEMPLSRLVSILENEITDKAADVSSQEKQRIESLCRSIKHRALNPAAGWRSMLKTLRTAPPEQFVDWFEVERTEGKDIDVGMHRHWLDPTQPFAETFKEAAHGIVITSASICDHSGEEETDWENAEKRTGITHFYPDKEKDSYSRNSLLSPFDYQNNSRVLNIFDVRKNNPEQVASAYKEIFKASKGGGLGIFTAISRLKEIYSRISEPLDNAGIELFAQHIDDMDTTSLIDIFKAEENSCLLGTDAVRDGVDVPGNSLRVIVFDRIPWPRSSILHKERRKHFGSRGYDDMLTRMKLLQAFGRLIRTNTDKGLFIILEPLPSRLANAFPEGVIPERVDLKTAVEITKNFVG